MALDRSGSTSSGPSREGVQVLVVIAAGGGSCRIRRSPPLLTMAVPGTL